MLLTKSRFWMLLLAGFVLTLLYVVLQIFYVHYSTLADSLPWTEQHRLNTYDFAVTPDEYACQHGFLEYVDRRKPPIPNVVHFIVGLHESDLSFAAYLSIRSALQILQPDLIKLHHTENLNQRNKYLRKLLHNRRVRLVHHDGKQVQEDLVGSSHYAHLADILRLKILALEGGIYLDADVYVLQSYDSLLTCPRDVMMGHEGGDRSGLANAVVLARPAAGFITRWFDGYVDFEEGEWNQHSVILPAQLATEPGHEEEICRLSPHAFFWPTWTASHVRWMHEPLTARQAVVTTTALQKNNGSLFEGQLAYHGWNSIAWEKHFSRLDEETVRTRPTRFNLMVRRFLDDE
jgi:hypothetical protein